MLPSPDDYNPDPVDRAIEPGVLWMLMAYIVVCWLTAEVVHGLGPRDQFEAWNRLHRGGHCPMAVSCGTGSKWKVKVKSQRIETWMIVACFSGQTWWVPTQVSKWQRCAVCDAIQVLGITLISAKESCDVLWSCVKSGLTFSSSWWFQIFLIFTPGEMIQFDEHIFQMGWFNNQLVLLSFPPFRFCAHKVEVTRSPNIWLQETYEKWLRDKTEDGAQWKLKHPWNGGIPLKAEVTNIS